MDLALRGLVSSFYTNSWLPEQISSTMSRKKEGKKQITERCKKGNKH